MHGKAKEETEISNEKEIVNQAVVQAMGEDRHGNVTEQNLKNALDNITGIGQTDVSDLGENYEVYFIKSKRYYEVDKKGKIVSITELDTFNGNYIVLKRNLNFMFFLVE